jgi:hypothetical protein
LGWLNKLLGEKPADASRQVNVSRPGLPISELDRWLGERMKECQIDEDILKIYSQLDMAARDLDVDIEKLRSASPPEGSPIRLIKAGLAAREAFCQQIQLLREKLQPPTESGIEQAVEQYQSIASHLSRTALKFGRAQSYAAVIFPDELKRINSDLARINQLLVDLEKKINFKQKEVKRLEELQGALLRFGDDRRRIESLKRDIADDQAALAKLRDSGKRIEGELEGLLRGQDGQRRENLRQDLDSYRLERSEIEAEAAALISPLSKAIARMIKQDSIDRVTLQNRRVLEQLSGFPLDSLDMEISSALAELQENINLLGIKDKKREKTLKHLSYLIESKPLEVLGRRHRMLKDKVAELERRLKEGSLETDRLEDELIKIKSQITRRDAEILQSIDKLAGLEERAAQDGEELKTMFFDLAEIPLVID